MTAAIISVLSAAQRGKEGEHFPPLRLLDQFWFFISSSMFLFFFSPTGLEILEDKHDTIFSWTL